MIQSKKIGCGVEDIYVPKLWCFRLLSYLSTEGDEEAGESSISFSSQNIELEDENSTVSISEDFSPLKAKKLKENKTISSLETKADGIIKSAMNIIHKISDEKVSPLEPYLRNLEVELSELGEDILRETKWNVSVIVHEAQLKQQAQKKLASTPIIVDCDPEEASTSTSNNNNNQQFSTEKLFDEDELIVFDESYYDHDLNN